MSKKHTRQPVPPANRPKRAFGGAAGQEAPHHSSENQDDTAGFNTQDPKRRLGDFESAGEHSRQEPGPLNDGDRHSK